MNINANKCFSTWGRDLIEFQEVEKNIFWVLTKIEPFFLAKQNDNLNIDY